MPGLLKCFWACECAQTHVKSETLVDPRGPVEYHAVGFRFLALKAAEREDMGRDAGV